MYDGIGRFDVMMGDQVFWRGLLFSNDTRWTTETRGVECDEMFELLTYYLRRQAGLTELT